MWICTGRFLGWLLMLSFDFVSNGTLRTQQRLNNIHLEHCLWMQVSAIIIETKTLWQSQPLPISVHWPSQRFWQRLGLLPLHYSSKRTSLHVSFKELRNGFRKQYKLRNSESLFQWPVFPYNFCFQLTDYIYYIMKICKWDYKDSPCSEWCVLFQRQSTHKISSITWSQCI